MSGTTNDLTRILISTAPADLGTVLEENRPRMVSSEHPFAEYFRELLRLRDMTQLSVIRRAGFSDKYGYRLLSEESHTRQRDYILRLCLAAELELDELQRVLRLYGMTPLYARVPRDAVILSAVSSGVYDIPAVNRLLLENGMSVLEYYPD